MVYRCNLCVHYTSKTLRGLISHLGRVHQNDRSFHVLCGIDGCPRTYKNFYTLRSHFVQKHSAILERERQNHQPQQAEPPANHGDNGANNDEGHGNDGFDFEREVEQCRRSNVLGLLKIKDEAKVPQTVVESIVNSTTQVVENSVDVLHSGVQQCLQNAGLQLDDIPGIAELFKESSSIRKPFQGCHNEASQLQYYKNNLGMVVSVMKYYLMPLHNRIIFDNKDSMYIRTVHKWLKKLMPKILYHDHNFNPISPYCYLIYIQYTTLYTVYSILYTVYNLT